MTCNLFGLLSNTREKDECNTVYDNEYPRQIDLLTNFLVKIKNLVQAVKKLNALWPLQ